MKRTDFKKTTVSFLMCALLMVFTLCAIPVFATERTPGETAKEAGEETTGRKDDEAAGQTDDGTIGQAGAETTGQADEEAAAQTGAGTGFASRHFRPTA